MTEPSKYTIHTEVNQIIETNTGTVIGKGDQHNYSVSPELDSTLKDLSHSLKELRKQHPNVTTATQAYDIIEAELIAPTTANTNKLVTLRKQLLNPERHLQASKATLAEVAKHYLEESVWAKAFITYSGY